ncbi:unnamed protein product [Angiostrongylus costaricensis]|uniref:Procollagen-lysine 5-dioxygenase n=1 Tax=Angiostrongylus costaricensis TaxID=334426 RepID=A0A0R3PF68_ANGCS|nr:unnamed protein product [Angiostrongylus costaricensis]
MLFLLATFALSRIISSSEKQEVMVVTVATEDTDGLRRLHKSAEKFDINIHVLGMGEDWNGGDTRIERGGGQKIRILREWLKQQKPDDDVLILFIDAYDVVFTAGLSTILGRFHDHFGDKRILFGAEPYCWPNESLAPDYPVVEFGKRFLNSGLFLGYAKEVYTMVTLRDVADNDDDQLYYTMIYLEKKLRDDLKIGLDSIARIFQNLNGVVDDVELQFDDEGNALAYNAAYNTHPAILHGNGPSKMHLNYLANYVSRSWSSKSGCAICETKVNLDMKDTDPADFPLVALSIFIAKPIPFVKEMLEALARMDYPKKKLVLFIYNSQRSNIKTVMDFLSEYGTLYFSKKIINGVLEIDEREARQEALGIVAPMIAQPKKMFTNFWGALSSNGYYARSEDYVAIVQRKRIGVWNVPFVTSAVLINKEKMREMKTPYFYDKTLDVDMSFCKWARDKGHFMYVDNEHYFGFLIVSEDYADIVHSGKLHPELWEIFENREVRRCIYRLNNFLC